MTKRGVSGIISGMGVGLSILTSLIEEVKERGGTDEDLHRLATPEGEGLIKQFSELVVKAGGDTFPVQVNYDLTVEQMVEDGHYNWSDPNITLDNFPVNRRGTAEVNIALVHLDWADSTDEVLRELDKRGFRPAELPELLAFGAKYSNKQREFPIVALGSVWQNPNVTRSVPILWGESDGRRVYLDWVGNIWGTYYRFAAVRK